MAQKSSQPTSSVEHIPATEHGKGFPPFDSQTFASQLIWFALTFIALYLIVSRLALPRIGSILQARRDQVEGDLTEAQRLRTDSDEALAAYEKALADARARAQAIAAENRDKLNAETEQQRKAVESDLNAKLEAAERTIAATKQAAMANVHGIAVDAASAIVERLIGSAPAAPAVERAVADSIKR